MPAACFEPWRCRPSSRSAQSKSFCSRSPVSRSSRSFGSISSALREREVLALLRRGIELRDAVGLGEREVEHAPDVLDRRFPLSVPNVMIWATRSRPYFSRT